MYLCTRQDLLANLLFDLMQFCIVIVHLHLDYGCGTMAQSIEGCIEGCVTLDVRRIDGRRSKSVAQTEPQKKVDQKEGWRSSQTATIPTYMLIPASAPLKKQPPYTHIPSSNRWFALATADGRKDISRRHHARGLGSPRARWMEGDPTSISKHFACCPPDFPVLSTALVLIPSAVSWPQLCRVCSAGPVSFWRLQELTMGSGSSRFIVLGCRIRQLCLGDTIGIRGEMRNTALTRPI